MADPMQRERITDIGKGDTYKSFIREYLCELTSCLSSDGAVGGSHNQIRDRVREIMASSNEYGPGRSALDARFALGADDDRYLATAVLPLWASFDSDEQLDLATDVPIEVREASAVGMVGHFRKMLDARESKTTSFYISLQDPHPATSFQDPASGPSVFLKEQSGHDAQMDGPVISVELF